jgi:ABC-2 type transport system permease protein
MLWHKAWLDTRWRFLIGFAVLMLLAAGNVFEYPDIARLRPAAASIDTGTGMIGRAIRNALEVQRDYRGYVWFQWVRQNLTQTWTLFALLIGSAGLVTQSGRRATAFTLTLPVSRRHLLGVHAAMGVAELLVLAVVPSLVFPLMSPAIGENYSLRTALVHAMCLFVAGSVFFSLTLLLSTVFNDMWRPLLLACVVAVVLGISEQVLFDTPLGIFRTMRAESYFRTGALPWPGLLTSATVSLALLYAAAANFAARDI